MKDVLRIWLVRHGETEWNRIHRFQGQSEVSLNEKGRAQAEALAVAFREESFQAVYSSPLIRAIETARAIARHHCLPVEPRGGLKEMHLGDFEGMEGNVLVRNHRDFLRAWMEAPSTVRMPNGENLAEVQERAWTVVEEIAERHRNGSVLLCGHNFVNLTILCKVLDLDLDRFRRLRQDTGARNAIERGRGGQYTLVVLNDTCHMKGLDDSL